MRKEIKEISLCEGKLSITCFLENSFFSECELVVTKLENM